MLSTLNSLIQGVLGSREGSAALRSAGWGLTLHRELFSFRVIRCFVPCRVSSLGVPDCTEAKAAKP